MLQLSLMNEPIELSTLAKIVTGKTPPTKVQEYFGGIYPFITPSDIPTFQEKHLPSTERSLSEKGKKYQKQLLIPKGAICYVSIGSTIGKICKTFTDSFTNQQIHSLIPYSDKADADFLYYLLRSITPYIQLIGDGKGSGKPIINKTEFSRVKVTVPDITIQKIVAPILSAYDDLIEVNNQRIKLLEQTARELYKEWFVRMRFPGYKQTKFKKGIPEGWVTEKFEKHIKIVRGKSYTSQEIDDNKGEYPFINLKNMNRGGGFRLDGTKFFTGKFKKEQIVTPGDIVMAVTDMTQDRLIVGRVARVPLTEHKEYVISLDIAKIISLELPPEFLYSTLRFNYYGESLAELANGTNVLHLSPDLLKKYSLLIPPNELTESFAEKVKPIYDLMDVLAIQNNQSREIRDRLLPRLISGKLEVKEKQMATV